MRMATLGHLYSILQTIYSEGTPWPFSTDLQRDGGTSGLSIVGTLDLPLL